MRPQPGSSKLCILLRNLGGAVEVPKHFADLPDAPLAEFGFGRHQSVVLVVGNRASETLLTFLVEDFHTFYHFRTLKEGKEVGFRHFPYGLVGNYLAFELFDDC